MRGGLACALMVLIAGCEEQKPHISDAEMQEIRTANPDLSEACLQKIRMQGIEAWPSPLERSDCIRMTQARRWSGLLELGWEWSNFCPAPARDCPISAETGDIWLEFAEGAHAGPEIEDGLYEIEFIGRRSVAPGGHGHLSQYDYLMIVDQVISIEKAPEAAEE